MKTETTNTLCPICGGKMDVKHVSSEAGRRLLKCPICGGEFIEVLSHWVRNGRVVYENPEIQLTTIRKVIGRNQRQKSTLVSKIKQRIESEHRKHPDLDWAEIAARKIYAEIKDEKQ